MWFELDVVKIIPKQSKNIFELVLREQEGESRDATLFHSGKLMCQGSYPFPHVETLLAITGDFSFSIYTSYTSQLYACCFCRALRLLP